MQVAKQLLHTQIIIRTALTQSRIGAQSTRFIDGDVGVIQNRNKFQLKIWWPESCVTLLKAETRDQVLTENPLPISTINIVCTGPDRDLTRDWGRHPAQFNQRVGNDTQIEKQLVAEIVEDRQIPLQCILVVGVVPGKLEPQCLNQAPAIRNRDRLSGQIGSRWWNL